MNNKKNEPHESACKGTCENTSITGVSQRKELTQWH